MNKIRFLTAGESHGPAINCIVEGMPSSLPLSESDIEHDLRRRQKGYGRGGRMKIEKDKASILSGVRYGKTLGSPISLIIYNKDWPNWTHKMSVTPERNKVPALTMPRPGHADYAGMVKYRQNDLRNILERSSARETAMRVAAGAIARQLLAQFDIRVWSHVTRIGAVSADVSLVDHPLSPNTQEWDDFFNRVEASDVSCADNVGASKMRTLIDQAKEKGYSLGGMIECVASGVPVGLGSHVHWDRKLNARLAFAMMSINAVKMVEIGLGKRVSELPGSNVHDELFYDKSSGYTRNHNHAGGIEGGMSNGEPVIIRMAMKPLPTMPSPLRSVNVRTLQPQQAHYERSDVCAVPAAAVVGEAMMALILSDALMEKIGGDSIAEMHERFKTLPHEPLDW